MFANYSRLESGRLSPVDVSPVLYDDLLVCNRIPGGSCITEQSYIRGMFDETMRNHEDWGFLLHHFVHTPWTYAHRCIVAVDNSGSRAAALSVRRRLHFWSDLVSFYFSYVPAHLASSLRAVLRGLGVGLYQDDFFK